MVAALQTAIVSAGAWDLTCALATILYNLSCILVQVLHTFKRYLHRSANQTSLPASDQRRSGVDCRRRYVGDLLKPLTRSNLLLV